MATKVILCCIRPNSEFQDSLESNDLITLFQKYGGVKTAQIFQRELILKSFIEFLDIQSAQNALNNFTDHTIAFGHLKVYPSKKKFIIANIQSKILKTEFQNPSRDVYLQPPSKNQGDSFPWDFSGLQPTNPYLCTPVQAFSKTEKNQTENIDNNSVLFDQLVNNANNPLSRLKLSYNENRGELKNRPTGIIETPSIFSLQKGFTVLRVDRINTYCVTSRILINFFTYFADLKRMILDTSQDYVLIEFSQINQMKHTIEVLRNQNFFGETLKFSVSRQSQIDFETFWRTPLSSQTKTQVSRASQNRHKSNLSTGVVSRPTSFLQISEVPVNFNSALLHILLSLVHEPKRVSKTNNLGNSSLIYIAEFKQLQYATEVLASLQNLKVDATVLRLDFLAY